MTHDNDNKVNKSKGRSSYQDPNKTDKAGRTKIFPAASSGNLDKVKELIERGADVNHRDNAGWTPIHVAALKGQYEITKYLIQSGAKVNVRGFEDDTPLHDACSYEHTDCVQLLVDAGADVYALNTDKKRPIDLCEDQACIDILKKRMNQLDCLAARDTEGKTSLHRACVQGSIHDVSSLLNGGIDTNAIDNLNRTALHYATQYNYLDIVQLLIQRGADINSSDDKGLTVLHIACQNGHDDIVQYLISNGADVHAVNKNGQSSYDVTNSVSIRQMITAYIDKERRLRATTEAIDEITFVSNTKKRRTINLSDNSSTNSIQDHSCLSREERKIQAIMKTFEKAEKRNRARRQRKEENKNAKASVNSTKKRKLSTSRECSVEVDQDQKKNGNIDFTKLDPHKKDTSGRTHLHRWSIRGNVQAVESLLKAGANPCEKDNAGYTPLHEAALRGKTGVVKLLLENKADVNCKGAELDTPLHDATENGFPEIVRLLLKYGADSSVKNIKGLTPLQIAIEEENTEIEAILKQHKVDVQSKKPKLVLANPRFTFNSNEALQSPTSPFREFDMSSAKAHARQLSGQHLPKKSFIPYLVKTEIPPDGPHTPIPTPPPERWQQKIIKREEDDIRLYNNQTEVLYPSIHCASRYLPLYTTQLLNDHPNSSHFFVVDLQISLLLGITTHQLIKRYPHLQRRPILSKEKERLWSPLSSMICSQYDQKHDSSWSEFKENEKQRFLNTDIYFVRLDQVVSMIKDDYSHLSESLITITLDIGYTSPLSTIRNSAKDLDNEKKKQQTVKLPPKFAMKMRKCGLL
ncbi:ankyrin repeat-containing domain protein [Cokeromyces recurvatus]|uniref:ankyrin repeat-containing domain protein n=1 Tax=Cokeromyces recurvatus TaxID=90255 RepID=UPI00221EF3B9|nr:ankyrin repeat-containing domain protein [Cokeromyces recurvatus]KAI7900482.1 ankyrin repeat-containing domain protein [Cokeromyces recurvatus]